MKLMIGGVTTAMALLLAGCGGGEGNLAAAQASLNAPLPQIAPPANSDWSQTVVETPEGGYRMGNPDAPVKLIEYGSLSCSHCAEFAHQASQPLRENYIRSGQVSWEFRTVIRGGFDLPPNMLLRCMGPAPFFRLSDQLFATQAEWLGRLEAAQAELQQLQTMSPNQQAAALARIMGTDQFFRRNGMPQARIDACLADPQVLERLRQTTDLAAQANIPGTPAFFINGQIVEATQWRADNPANSLETRLRAAIGG